MSRKTLAATLSALLLTGGTLGLTACQETAPTASKTPGSETTPIPSGPKKWVDPLGITTEFTTEPSESEDPLNINAQVRLNRVEGAVTGQFENTFARYIVYFDGEPAAPLQWSATGWQDEVIADGSGEPIDLAGARKLQIVIAGVAYPENLEDPHDVPLTKSLDPAITDATIELPFEGYSRFQIAADEDFPYRVTVLDNPTRLVLDVKTPTILD